MNKNYCVLDFFCDYRLLVGNCKVNQIFRFIRLVIDCRLFISLAAVGLTMSTFRILKVDIDWKVLLVVSLSTLTAYSFPYFLKLPRFFFKWWLFALFFCAIGIFSASILYFGGNQVAFIIYAALSFSTLFYYIPLGFIGRLRELPYLKAFLISITWTITTIALPVAYIDKVIFDTNVLWLFFERFLFLLAVTIPFDVRDLKKDLEDGLVTFPVTLGLKGALYLSSLLLIGYLVVSLFHLGFGNILFVRAVCVFLVLILIQNISHKKSSYYYTGLIDGSMIFQSILMLIMA